MRNRRAPFFVGCYGDHLILPRINCQANSTPMHSIRYDTMLLDSIYAVVDRRAFELAYMI
jgi:hypothetical protein